MGAASELALRFLWHPGTGDLFSGYGLVVKPAHLVGLVMVDRPDPVDPQWLATIQSAFGDYQLVAMTQGGARGIVCQMVIAADSIQYLRMLPDPRLGAIRQALLPLVQDLPAVTLELAWYPGHRCWVSQIVQREVPLFPLGQLVATPGALRALQRGEQSPIEFINRHVRGDWGELDEVDTRPNGFQIENGGATRNEYAICDSGGRKRGGLGMRRGVDDDELGPMLTGGFEDLGKSGCLRGNHHRGVILACIAPAGGARLRVEVNDNA